MMDQQIVQICIVLICLLSCDLNKSYVRGEDVVIRMKMADLVPAQSIEEDTGCDCVCYNCGCCVRIFIPEIELDQTGCANITYLPDQYGIQVTFTIGRYTIINMTVSASNPPPFCVAIPYLHEMASLCFYLYNLQFTNEAVTGCSRIDITVLHVRLFEESLGCFRIPLKSDEAACQNFSRMK